MLRAQLDAASRAFGSSREKRLGTIAAYRSTETLLNAIQSAFFGPAHKFCNAVLGTVGCAESCLASKALWSDSYAGTHKLEPSTCGNDA